MFESRMWNCCSLSEAMDTLGQLDPMGQSVVALLLDRNRGSWKAPCSLRTCSRTMNPIKVGRQSLADVLKQSGRTRRQRIADLRRLRGRAGSWKADARKRGREGIAVKLVPFDLGNL